MPFPGSFPRCRRTVLAALCLALPAAAQVRVAIVPHGQPILGTDPVPLAAQVAGAANTRVTWAVLTPNAGHCDVDAGGTWRYLPPAGVEAVLEVQVRATSVADSAVSAVTTLVVLPGNPLAQALHAASDAKDAAAGPLPAAAAGKRKWEDDAGETSKKRPRTDPHAAPATPVRVQVAADADLVFAGDTLACTATVTGTANLAVVWSVTCEGRAVSAMPRPGQFLAPWGPGATYRIRATSVADRNAFGEVEVGVGALVSGSDGTVIRDIESLVQGYLAHPNWTRPGLPFLDTETDERYDPAAWVHDGHGSLNQPTRVLGYGLPIPLRWSGGGDETLGRGLTFREGGDLVRRFSSGQDGMVVKLTGGVHDGWLEELHRPVQPDCDSHPDCLTSTVAGEPLQVRGVVPFAGRCIYGPAFDAGDDDGEHQGARFQQPMGMAELQGGADEGSLILVADPASHVLRQVSEAGKVTTPCGKIPKEAEAPEPGYRDGQGNAARFHGPTFLLADGAYPHPVLVADSGNHVIRAVDGDYNVTTRAGKGAEPGFQDGPAAQARFRNPQGLAKDWEHVLYVADAGNFRIRRIDRQGQVSTLAGTGVQGGADGGKDQASFSALRGMVFSLREQCLYVVDQHAIRRVSLQGEVTTVIGAVAQPGYLFRDDSGPGHHPPALNGPCGLDMDAQGRLLIADTGNHCVRRVTIAPGGAKPYQMETLVGSRDWDQTRWGLIRDGLPWALQAHAALASPRVFGRLGLDKYLVSNGNGLAWLASVDVEREVSAHLDPAPACARKGSTLTQAFRIEPLPGRAGRSAKALHFWSLALCDAFTGKVLGVQTGSCRAGQKMTVQVPLPAAGIVDVRLTVLSETGVGVYAVNRFTVVP